MREYDVRAENSLRVGRPAFGPAPAGRQVIQVGGDGGGTNINGGAIAAVVSA